jgi:hypothetical protein
MTTIEKNIAAAFIKAQSEMGNATKDSNNPFFQSKYADLNSIREACLPALNNNGIAVLQPTTQIEGKNYVKTILVHESGETIESLTEILFAKQNDPQAQGSGITYARRYGLQSLVNIGAEDDDGNKASEKPKGKIASKFTKEPTGAMANIANSADEDSKEVKRQGAEKYFRDFKVEIENCGSYSEIEGLFERDKAIINKLERDHKDLFNKLIECQRYLKEALS